MGQVVFGSVHGSSRSTDSTGSFTKPSVSILAMERPLAAKANLPFRYSTPGHRACRACRAFWWSTSSSLSLVRLVGFLLMVRLFVLVCFRGG